MKRIMLIFTLLLMVTLTACDQTNEVLPNEVTMENLDEILEFDNIQLVDVRNWDEKMSSGYIKGFEQLPLFDYFEQQGHIVRADGDMNFDPEDIINEVYIKNFFEEDAKGIYIMCSSGKRSNYMVELLTHLGYTNVVDLGAFSSYLGENKIVGDGVYEFPKSEE